MSDRLSGHTALVTGAAQGLGEAMARALWEAGAHVVLCDISETLEKTAAGISADGTRVSCKRFDVAEEAAWENAVAEVMAEQGSLEILVNNAAMTLSKPLWDIPVEEWDRVMAVNLRGLFLGCRSAGRIMRDKGYGRIINLSSLAGQRGGVVAGGHYSASKGAILSLSKCFAQELAPNGVTVNCIAPAAIEGPMSRAMPKEKVDGLAATIPVRRLGRDTEVGAAAVYLADPGNGYVTGSTLDVNGGVLMR
ncbi:SDR family NAD(P)-dependent oxidoreductase [Pseudooceanicola sp. HF7]|uniref:SDR family NAD(P)-dependent oxidoreductase n=1 Tax=Pseudooceanicola sp. HF7 TaxID=2721560 RepID=UPI00142F99CC|nr:SDR family NAD(P)-dependent oxidoreductase [Pseudooceanicola sp. HF7]NIZ10589.1 SDR family oxidoreductase [Pseudooceanicola sp. HF7]